MSKTYHRSFLLATAIVQASFACLTSIASAAEADWRVGLASVCITPEEPVWLYGYASKSRFRPFEDILDHIYARAANRSC